MRGALVPAAAAAALVPAALAATSKTATVACRVPTNLEIEFQAHESQFTFQTPQGPRTQVTPAHVAVKALGDHFADATFKTQRVSLTHCRRYARRLPAAPHRLGALAKWTENVNCILPGQRVAVHVEPLRPEGSLVTVRLLNGRYLTIAYLRKTAPRIQWSARYCEGTA